MHTKSLWSCLCLSVNNSLPGSSVHGILQARVLEWVAISSSRGSSQPRGRTRLSYMRHLLHWQVGSLLSTTWEAQVFELTEIKGRWVNRPPDSAASKHVHTHKNCCSPKGLKSFGASIPRSRPPGALQLCRRAEKSLCAKAGPTAFCSFSPQAFAARVTYNCLRVLSRFPLR